VQNSSATTYKLSISMVPAALWGENLRELVSRRKWERFRATQFERSPDCELCGSAATGSARHAHEMWVYDPKAGVARLVGLQTICRMCHFVMHPGFVECAVDEGQLSADIFDEMERHFCSVNKCKPEHYLRHQQQAERRYSKLAKVKSWTIDFGPYADLVARRPQTTAAPSRRRLTNS